MNTDNYGVGSSTTWATNEWTLCTNRLPCGICRLMQAACPLAVKPYDVTWENRVQVVPYEVTCKAEVQG